MNNVTNPKWIFSKIDYRFLFTNQLNMGNFVKFEMITQNQKRFDPQSEDVNQIVENFKIKGCCQIDKLTTQKFQCDVVKQCKCMNKDTYLKYRETLHSETGSQHHTLMRSFSRQTHMFRTGAYCPATYVSGETEAFNIQCATQNADKAFLAGFRL